MSHVSWNYFDVIRYCFIIANLERKNIQHIHNNKNVAKFLNSITNSKMKMSTNLQWEKVATIDWVD